MKNASNTNFKVTKIQENQKNNPIFTQQYDKPYIDNNKLRWNQNNTRIYNKPNEYNQTDKKKRYTSSMDKNVINTIRRKNISFMKIIIW